MPRKAETYRAARRNAAKGSLWRGAKARVEPYQGRGKVYRAAVAQPISRVLGGRRA